MTRRVFIFDAFQCPVQIYSRSQIFRFQQSCIKVSGEGLVELDLGRQTSAKVLLVRWDKCRVNKQLSLFNTWLNLKIWPVITCLNPLQMQNNWHFPFQHSKPISSIAKNSQLLVLTCWEENVWGCCLNKMQEVIRLLVSGIKNMENYMYTWNVGESETNHKKKIQTKK